MNVEPLHHIVSAWKTILWTFRNLRLAIEYVRVHIRCHLENNIEVSLVFESWRFVKSVAVKIIAAVAKNNRI